VEELIPNRVVKYLCLVNHQEEEGNNHNGIGIATGTNVQHSLHTLSTLTKKKQHQHPPPQSLLLAANINTLLILRIKDGTGIQKQIADWALHDQARFDGDAKIQYGRREGIPPMVVRLNKGSLLQKLPAVSTLVCLGRNCQENRRVIVQETVGCGLMDDKDELKK